MPKQTQPKSIPTFEDAQSALGNDRMNFMSQMLGQQLEAEEEMPPPQVRKQNQSSPQPLPPIPGA